ncbi:MAG: nuclear transport factor 2 family protein [Halobacteria archaeon]
MSTYHYDDLSMSKSPKEFVESYYETLRDGEPLEPYFRDVETTVKFGISEELYGYDETSEGLRRQTDSTRDWKAVSRDLRIFENDGYARFTDEVTLGWYHVEREDRSEFDTRWSGVMVRGSDGNGWVFTQMHVSAPHQLG